MDKMFENAYLYEQKWSVFQEIFDNLSESDENFPNLLFLFFLPKKFIQFILFFCLKKKLFSISHMPYTINSTHFAY
jgi:hypothetical protein